MFKVRLKERLFIIFFACFLAIYPPTVKYQEVQALEWAIPTVAFDTALKFLLGLLGVSITSKALHDNVDWHQVQQDAMNYQIQKGNDAVAVGEWWEDVAKGTLNQASSCWSAFKEWVQSMLSSDNEYLSLLDEFLQTGTVSYDNGYTITYSQFNLNALNSTLSSATLPSWFSVSSFNGVYYTWLNSGHTYTFFYALNPSYDYTFDNRYMTISSTSAFDYVRLVIDNGSSNSYTADVHYFNDSVTEIQLEKTKIKGYFSTLDVAPSDSSIFDSANEKIEDTAITTGDTTTTAIPDTIPLPWDNVSDAAEGVADSIDALQEQVAEGVLSLEDYWEKIQEMINALAIDTTTEETLPVTQNPDTGETEKIEDIANENVSNTAFTLNGLEKVFPFCIPWDIYSFVTLLVADPVAPVINYPIYNPVTNQDINITIDFSDWETVVVLFRYILDFLLIIGLLLLARQLAGAGGDD